MMNETLTNESTLTRPQVNNEVILDSFKRQISLIDVKIQKAMAKNDNPANKMERIPSEIQEKIDQLDNDIKKMVLQAEYLGDAGKLEESERINDEIQKLRRQREDLITIAENPTMMAKQMKVCDICGAMQATNDTEKRNQTHLEGKVHTGFLKLREELQKLIRRKEMLKMHATTQKALKKEEYKKLNTSEVRRRSPNKDERDKREMRDNGKDRERDEKRRDKRDRSRERSRDRDRSRERTRDKPRKDREKSRDRSRDRSAERKDKKKDKKDKDKKKRSRSRS